jgi:hypothetical protein
VMGCLVLLLIEGRNPDEGDYVLSNTSYGRPTIGKICTSLGPMNSKSVYVEQNKLNH